VTRREASALGVARWRQIREDRIEDYLFTGGHRMPARAAAQRLGVSERTIERYRRELRQRGRLS
jgi:transposase